MCKYFSKKNYVYVFRSRLKFIRTNEKNMSNMFSLLLTIGEANQRIGVKYEEERLPLREEKNVFPSLSPSTASDIPGTSSMLLIQVKVPGTCSPNIWIIFINIFMCILILWWWSDRSSGPDAMIFILPNSPWFKILSWKIISVRPV